MRLPDEERRSARSQQGASDATERGYCATAAKDVQPSAAGLAIREPGGELLFVRRSGWGDHGGEWAFPGGMRLPAETGEQCARRETIEEIGWHEPGGRWLVHRTAFDEGTFHTYLQHASSKFEPRLNQEHNDYVWADPSSPPEPLHPGVAEVLPHLARPAEDGREEHKHPRGQPKNKGQFAKKPASAEEHHQGNLAIDEYLGKVESLYGPGRKTVMGFVRAHGRPFIPNEKTYEGKRGKPKLCYMNAFHDMLDHPDRDYVEGYITVHGVPIQHAWTVDKTGQIYDPTLKDGQHVKGYYGVQFSREYAIKSTVENGVYGLLGMESHKTIMPLLEGKTKNFAADIDPDKLSEEAVKTRIRFADDVQRRMERTDKIDTPERNMLRAHAEEELYRFNEDTRRRERDATIVLGLPAPGKSTYVNPLLKEKGALEIEGDNAKALLPEFRGGLGAQAVHEEASTIMRNVLARAIKNGDNIVWARIDSPSKVEDDINNLKKAGYKVKITLIDADPDLATLSCVRRFLKMNRFIPPAVVKEYGFAPVETYNVAKFQNVADSYERLKREPDGLTRVESHTRVDGERSSSS